MLLFINSGVHFLYTFVTMKDRKRTTFKRFYLSFYLSHRYDSTEKIMKNNLNVF